MDWGDGGISLRSRGAAAYTVTSLTHTPRTRNACRNGISSDRALEEPLVGLMHNLRTEKFFRRLDGPKI